MNKYLEKIAKVKDKSNTRLAGEAAAGVALVSGAPSRILGYHTMYHGTNDAAAKKIREEGFKTKFGGSGESSVQQNFQDLAKNKIHLTKSKTMARQYAAFDKVKGYSPNSALDTVKASLLGFKHGKVVKVRVSNSMFDKMKVDPFYTHILDPRSKDQIKAQASTFHHNIPKGMVSGSNTNKGALGFLSKNHLRRVYSTSAGKLRALRGVGLGLAGAGLVSHAISSKLNQDKR